jgi:hypothetical protein
MMKSYDCRRCGCGVEPFAHFFPNPEELRESCLSQSHHTIAALCESQLASSTTSKKKTV